MSTTIGELEGKILSILQKNAGTQGFYTPEKVRDAIQDCFDYVEFHMFDAANAPWSRTISYITIAAGQMVVPMPKDTVIIYALRYKLGDVYYPMIYDNKPMAERSAPQSSQSIYPSSYSIINSDIYLDPTPSQGGESFLQIEYSYFSPKFLMGVQQEVPDKFNRAFQNYIKFRAASILASTVGKSMKEWIDYENQWYDVMIKLCDKRIKTVQFIKNFDG